MFNNKRKIMHKFYPLRIKFGLALNLVMIYQDQGQGGIVEIEFS
jgi:hypothetical protein